MSIRSKGTSLAMGLNRMMSGAIATLFLSMNQVSALAILAIHWDDPQP